MKTPSSSLRFTSAFTALALLAASCLSANAGTIYALSNTSTSVNSYSDTGTLIQANLISGLSTAWGVAVSGDAIYVVERGTPPNANGVVHKYKLDGTVVNNSLISGLLLPSSIKVSGTDLYVVTDTFNTIAKYKTDGTVVNAKLITGLSSGSKIVDGIAISGTDLYVGIGDAMQNGVGSISKYKTDGSTVASPLISVGFKRPVGLAVSGTNLYVSDIGTGKVGLYTTSGQTTNASLISGLTSPSGLIVNSTGIIVTSPLSYTTIGKYDLTGNPINTSLISFGATVLAVAEVATKPAAPTVKVTGKTTITTTASTYKLKGTSANATSVKVRVRTGAAYVKATGVANWSFKAKLNKGLNTILVRAYNDAGASSQAAKVKITRE